jgi:hypothetical protein
MKPHNPNSVILWEGASLIDGAPIAVIATGLTDTTDNTKTGAMIQTWIMRSDVAPHVAVKTGQDASVCGDCSLRPIHYKARGKKKPCYVRTFQAPRSTWATYKRGRYRKVTPAEARAMFAGRKLRLGSYGNPSAAPIALWQEISAETAGHTGYIHNWRTADPQWSDLVMASVESVSEGLEARKLGYRLFRVRSEAESLQPREIACPASKESGFKTTCFSCNACGGHSSKARVDIAIMAH